ncbi:MAG: hypothetical protein AB7H97_16535 [Pseudobdellovibrionaceae bacterium]
MLKLIVVSFLSVSAHADLLDPVDEAAENLGYQVVGAVEFARGKSGPDLRQMKKNMSSLGEICPRTQAWDRSISSRAHFVVIAWSDHEFPPKKLQSLPSKYLSLAQARATRTAQFIRDRVRGDLHFEMVNMATRRKHLVPVKDPSGTRVKRQDVKRALELAGAAPSDAFSMGLFGEHAQKSKALIWVECFENLVKRRPDSAPQNALAWGKMPSSRGTYLNL